MKLTTQTHFRGNLLITSFKTALNQIEIADLYLDNSKFRMSATLSILEI